MCAPSSMDMRNERQSNEAGRTESRSPTARPHNTTQHRSERVSVTAELHELCGMLILVHVGDVRSLQPEDSVEEPGRER
jgi:hypothetical protein